MKNPVAMKLAFCLLAATPGLTMGLNLTAEALAHYAQRLPEAVAAEANPVARQYLQRLLDHPDQVADAAARRDASIRIANALRVADGMREHPAYPLPRAPLTWYAVPAISDVMRLPETFPVDGTLAGPLRVVAAKDEYQPASFVVFAFDDLSGVELNISALNGPDGAVVPAANLDLKVVKVWYQNGNGWFSYFADPGLRRVPELLLNDENLIRVDTQARANYARIADPAGMRHTWISPPGLLDSRCDEHRPSYMHFPTFRPLAEPYFTDAPTLQPVKFTAGEFKQFWLTVHAPADAVAGIYRGAIAVKVAGVERAAIPVALRLLPFELPEPRTYFDLQREFLVSTYGGAMIHDLMRENGGDRDLAEQQLLAMLKNMRRHNMRHPRLNYHWTTLLSGGEWYAEMLKRHIELMEEAGLSTRPLIGNTMIWLAHGGDPLTYDQRVLARRDADRWRHFYQSTVGHTEAYIQSGDEAPARWVAKMRPAWQLFHERGLKIFTAGHGGMFIKGGYTYDMHPRAGYPEDETLAAPWNKVGHAYVGFYAGQHNGVENPAFVRRQHGLLSYLSGFSMVKNYKFAIGPWNDLSYDLYKPMVQAYPTYDGLVDTLHWEGFREAIDDIRYATLLMQRAHRAIDSGVLEQVYEGRKVLHWFAQMDGRSVDLNAVRSEMVHKILQFADDR